MRFKKIKAIPIAILLFLFLCTTLVLLINPLLQNPAVKTFLLESLGNTAGYDFEAADLDITFRDGIGISAKDLVAVSRVRPERIEASRFNVALNTTELIKGRIIPSKVWIFRPRIKLTIKRWAVNLTPGQGSVFTQMIVATLSGLRSGSIQQGSLDIQGIPIKLTDLNFTVNPDKKDPTGTRVTMQGKATFNQDHSRFMLQGLISGKQRPESGLFADMTLTTEKFPLTWVPRTKFLLFHNGTAQAHIKFKAAPGDPVSAEGKITGEEVQFSLTRRGRSKEYCFDHLQADFDSHYSEKTIVTPFVRLAGSNFSISANSQIDLAVPSNPHVTFELKTPLLMLTDFKRLFPTIYVPPWVKEKIFPNLSKGKARVDHYSITGTWDQLKHVKHPANRDVISLKIDWEGLRALADGGGLPFENISGELHIERGDLSTTVTNAAFGNSIIHHAVLNVPNLYEKPTYDLAVKGLFDLQDLKQQAGLNVMPAIGKQFFHEFANLTGTLEGHVQMGFEKGWGNLKINDGKFIFNNCSVTHKALCMPITLDEANIRTGVNGKNMFSVAGQWGDSEFQMTGVTDSRLEVRRVDVESRVQMNEILDYFYQGNKLPLRYQGLVPWRATLVKIDGGWACQGEVELENIWLKTDFISGGSFGQRDKAVFDINFYPGEMIKFNGLKFYLGESVLGLNGSWGLKTKDAFHMRLWTERLRLKDLDIQFKELNLAPDGEISFNGQVKGRLGSPLETSVTGTIKGQKVSFVSKRLPLPVDDCHFHLDFSGHEIVICSLFLHTGESSLDIQGRLQGWDAFKGEIQISSDLLNFSDFIPMDFGPLNKTSKRVIFLKKSNIKLMLDAPKARWKGLTFVPLQAECHFCSGDFLIKHIKARTAHGTLSARGLVKGKGMAPRISLASEIKLNQQPIDELQKCLGLKKSLEGSLTMNADLSAKGEEPKDLVSGLTGRGGFLLEEGSILKKQGIVFNLLEILNLQNILKMRMPDFAEKGYYFERMEAQDITIKEGTIMTEGLVFESPVFNAAAQGNVYLSTKKVDFKLWVQTLETMDTIIGRVPIIGYILTGKEKSPKGVLIYPYEVKGNWSNPRIKSSVLKNVGSGVLGIFKRILLTPGHIYKEISEITSDIFKGNGSLPENRVEGENSEIPQ